MTPRARCAPYTCFRFLSTTNFDREPTPPNPHALDYHDRLRQFSDGNCFEHSLHVLDCLTLAQVTAAKQHHPRPTCSGLSEQPRIVEIGGHDHALFGTRAGQYYSIRCSCQTNIPCVCRVVSMVPEPCRESRRQGHVDKELHRDNSTVSSSARNAAYRSAASTSPDSR
jgi:hypothetical protein